MSVKQKRTAKSVEIEFDGGEALRVTGDEAKKWQEMVESQALCAFVHGMKYPDLVWETVARSKSARRSRRRG